MKSTLLICCALGLVLLSLSYTPQHQPLITIHDDSLSISVTEVDDGILTGNLSTVACTVFVMSPEGEQEFELAAGESVTVTGITGPSEGWAVGGESGGRAYSRRPVAQWPEMRLGLAL